MIALACSPAADAVGWAGAAGGAKLTTYLDAQFEQELQMTPKWRQARQGQLDKLSEYRRTAGRDAGVSRRASTT
jgi:hypothetical protein